MEEMYIYRISRCLEDFGLKISRQEALEFQRRYADGQQHIQMSKTIKKLLTLCTSSCRQETALPVLGVITNGESKHQQKKVDTWASHNGFPKNIFSSPEISRCTNPMSPSSVRPKNFCSLTGKTPGLSATLSAMIFLGQKKPDGMPSG